MELDQFCILARSQKGRACAALIQQVLGNKKIFVFGELLSVPSVLSLKENEEFKKYYTTLELFAYGTYKDYIGDQSKYLELTDIQEKKLKILTLVTSCSQTSVLLYETLQEELKIKTIRELEDLIIEAIYQNLVSGKLDQKTNVFKVKSYSARDVHPSSLPQIIQQLELWKEACKRGNKTLEDISIYMKEKRQAGISEQEAIQQIMKQVRSSLKETIAKGPESSRTLNFPFTNPSPRGRILKGASDFSGFSG